MNRYLPVPLVFLVSLGLFTACGVGYADAVAPTLAPDATAQDVVDAARDAMADITSYRWTSDVRIDDILDTAPAQVRTEVVWRAPDDYSFVATYEHENGPIVHEERWVEGRALRLIRGAWVELRFRDPTPGIPQYRGSVEMPLLDSNAFAVGPTDPTLYALTGEFTTTTDNPNVGIRAFEFTVRQSDLRLASLTQELELIERGLLRVTTQFSAYNEPVTIETPADYTPRPDPNSTPQPDHSPTPTPRADVFLDAS
jgi:hypothetical protein